jgi:hypothetical protein
MTIFRDHEGNFYSIPDEELQRYRVQGELPEDAQLSGSEVGEARPGSEIAYGYAGIIGHFYPPGGPEGYGGLVSHFYPPPGHHYPPAVGHHYPPAVGHHYPPAVGHHYPPAVGHHYPPAVGHHYPPAVGHHYGGPPEPTPGPDDPNDG